MRWLRKGREPPALRDYRVVPGATWDGADFTAVKDDLRAALLRDQEWLCCYCMRRISSDERPHPANPQAPSPASLPATGVKRCICSSILEATAFGGVGRIFKGMMSALSASRAAMPATCEPCIQFAKVFSSRMYFASCR